MNPTRSEVFRSVVGDLARPFAIVSTSAAASVATVTIAFRIEGYEGAAAFIGAVFAGVAALYGAKAWENAKTGQAAADVAKATSTPAPPAPGTANVQAAPNVTVEISETDTTPGEGELPPSERIK